jgi:GntR family transcriptional regulator/MocR family aminotransferase
VNAFLRHATSPNSSATHGPWCCSAYEQLLAEGFAEGRGGSGTYLPEGLGRTAPIKEMRSATLKLSRYGSAAADAVEAVDSPRRRASPVRYDFAYGRRAIESFPREMWRRILLRHARQAPVREFEYGPAAGSLVLREAICAHLRRSRAVVCDPSEIILANGSQQALDLVTRVLVEGGDRVPSKIRNITARVKCFAPPEPSWCPSRSVATA